MLLDAPDRGDVSTTIGPSSGNAAYALVVDPSFEGSWLRDMEVYGSSTYQAGPLVPGEEGEDPKPAGWAANQIDEDSYGPGNLAVLAMVGATATPGPGILAIQHHMDDKDGEHRYTTPIPVVVGCETVEPDGDCLPDYGNEARIVSSPELFEWLNSDFEPVPHPVYFTW
ncbi:MAG: hypothetical protein JRI25_16490 [Deltaproteobacteria bacterium]|nr:hypothetical protein [Deltaproteobacteria bacterium]